MKELVCNNAVFGIVLCALAWQIGLWAAKMCKHHPLVHPMLVAVAVAVAVLLVFDIPLEWFRQGADYIDMLLLPATAALGLSIYRQRRVLKENFWPVVLGCAAGAAANALVAIGLCRLLALDASLTNSVLPHSVTTPIAIALSEEAGGLQPRRALALSQGTADQLYLAVRLAVCELTLPDAPMSSAATM